ncbi:MAG: hypothetical protein JST67_09720 [Bacteroidetes bacterium]|nr:hypothetical protein [Bacteroidota bacterium]
MYRKDFLDREFEKLGLLLATLLQLKKSGKTFDEIEQAVQIDLKNIVGDSFDLKTAENDINVYALSSDKQQALANLLFEMGILAQEQNKPEAACHFFKQYLHVVSLAEEKSHTFSFQNLYNKALAQKIIRNTP